MGHFIASLGAKSKLGIILFSSRLSSPSSPLLSRHITSCLASHDHHFPKTVCRRVSTNLFNYCRQRRQHSTKAKQSDPLHILFCGSDEFSCASLEALHREHVTNPDLIRSIDVVLRPGKPTGRGFKTIKHPPIRSLAERLGLQIHERDTFTGWDMPQDINLIVAVSFGLFVPPRLLHKAKYGGLNVHPSLLPDLRGPAPLHHALLAGYDLTGVSLQTLDDKTFDNGIVLAQTPAYPTDDNALRIPPDVTTVPALQALVTPVAADLLIQGLREGLHVPPLEDVSWQPDAKRRLLHAPKITSRDRQLTLALLRSIDNGKNGPRALMRPYNAIGPLWFLSRNRDGVVKRVIITAMEGLPDPLKKRPERAMVLDHDKPFPEPELVEIKKATGKKKKKKPVTLHHRRCHIIPFLEAQDEPEVPAHTTTTDTVITTDTATNATNATATDANATATATTTTTTTTPAGLATPRLILWDSLDAPADGRTPGQLTGGDSGGVDLGAYRIRRLKVEGEQDKDAWTALRNLILKQ
ncbi:Formyltransferase [Xylaria sp. CBS 124048]|nr:Formyltransferase [Xylaria sp. CBS 124048]